jgi:hypothetical protein
VTVKPRTTTQLTVDRLMPMPVPPLTVTVAPGAGVKTIGAAAVPDLVMLTFSG